MLPPRSFRIPLIAVDRLRVRTDQITSRVKWMDGHIGQQNMVHFLAEPSKMSRDKKINVHRRNLSDEALIQQAPDFAHGRMKPAILDDRMNEVILLCKIDQMMRVDQIHRKRLLFEDVATPHQPTPISL